MLVSLDDLQHLSRNGLPSRAPETVSLNRCRQRLWYARPVDRELGAS